MTMSVSMVARGARASLPSAPNSAWRCRVPYDETAPLTNGCSCMDIGQIGELRRLRCHSRSVPGAESVRGDAACVEHDFALTELLHEMRVVRGDDHGHADF